MNLLPDFIHSCRFCGTLFNTMDYDVCPKCHRSIDSVCCTICNTIYDTKEHEACPLCHSTQGSVRCSECEEIINDSDNFCSQCGADRRWRKFVCPNCYESVLAHRWPGRNDDDFYQVTCPKCGHRFFRPDKPDPTILY